MLTEQEYIKKYLLNKNVYSPSMAQTIDLEIAKLQNLTLNKKQQKYYDRLLYKKKLWLLCK